MAVTITKDTIIGDILDIAPETAPLFMAIGMHCLGCPASRGERQMYTATCASCGCEAKVPFQPRDDRPVYCSECFAKMKEAE